MTKIVLLLLLAVVVAMVVPLAIALLKKSQGTSAGAQRGPSAYCSLETLLSPAELQFFRVLEAAVEGQFRVFSKVRMADIVRPVQTGDKRAWYSAFGVIKSKHVDFVLCDPESMEFRGVVELDDKSHARDDRAERDLKVDAILSQAGIPAIHVPARASYSVQEIQERLFAQPLSKGRT